MSSIEEITEVQLGRWPYTPRAKERVEDFLRHEDMRFVLLGLQTAGTLIIGNGNPATTSHRELAEDFQERHPGAEPVGAGRWGKKKIYFGSESWIKKYGFSRPKDVNEQIRILSLIREKLRELGLMEPE